jgi:peptidoglycan/xylan/chitin deacetylase (PgdA/CDA1 family)
MKRRVLIAAVVAVVSVVFSAQTSGRIVSSQDAVFTMRVPVLTYHRILCQVPADRIQNTPLFMCPENLDAQMALLQSQGWHTVTAGALADAMESHTCLPAKTFVIFDDDGPLDAYTNGAPIWEKHGFTATFAMVVGKTGWTEAELPGKPHFDWDQARDLMARGFEIANHTWMHMSVPRMNTLQFYWEVIHASSVMKEETGVAPKVFVYPYGGFNSASPSLLRPFFEMAFTTQPSGVYSTNAMMTAPRVEVYRWTTPDRLVTYMNRYAHPCPGE